MGKFIKLLLLFPVLALAQEAEPVKSSELDKIAEETLALMDGTHDYVSSQLHDWIDGLDQFFGDEQRYIDRANSSQFLLRYQATRYKDGTVVWEPRLRVRLDLPRTKKRLRLMIETDGKDQGDGSNDSPVDALGNNIRETVDPDFFSTALQLVITATDDIQINARAGVAFRDQPDPFTLLRAQAQTNFEKWNFRFSQYIYEYLAEGFGEESLVDIERKLFDNMLFRFNGNLNWWNSFGEFESSESASLLAAVTPYYGVSLTALTEQAPSDGWRTKNHFLFMTNRLRIHKHWIFLQLVPQLQFRPEHHFRAEPSITAGIEVLFGKKVDRKAFPRRPKRMETLEGPQRSFR